MKDSSVFLSSVIGLRHQKMVIGIRNLELSDINSIYCSWLNDPEVNRYLESRFTIWDIEKTTNFYIEKSNDGFFWAILDLSKMKHIGNVKLSSIDKNHNRVDLGIMIGDKDYWGKGIATEVIKIVTDYCFSQLNIHKITAGAYGNNHASINAFLKNGFIIEGEMLKHFKTSTGWTSAVLLSKINDSIGE
ncbi:GNAT family N-acetyltransferase [Aeromonas hydrophila]|uniref:GNAT family N-acetyltransferase n=1 Tax=Aeromonas hydrophila TaxID=644 RepID=UPI0029D61665|nr:GNAT family N-acetyltransferase [Aeromonas hydrophila]MBX9567002.1 GNAT family N-acetyltransferase [Aeromonas hydrophila]MDX7758243.1 GNAT family N-acetyltransferase [Aeromonas hydrophila]